MPQKSEDFFNKAAGFIEAFNRVCEKGFFSDLTIATSSYGEKFMSVKINATGYVPDTETDNKKGINPFINPSKIINKIRNLVQAEAYQFKLTRCEIKISDWFNY